jgi:hypothetical protein
MIEWRAVVALIGLVIMLFYLIYEGFKEVMEKEKVL